MWHHGGWGLMGGWGFGPGLHGGLFWLLVLAAVVALVVWLLRPAASAGRPVEARSRGLDLLEERYARGEIGRDEYLQKKRDLSG